MLSEAVIQRVRQDFLKDYQRVADVLLNDCGRNLPFCDQPGYESLIERIRLSVLKISQGDLYKLRTGVEAAKQDGRDLLLAAGL